MKETDPSPQISFPSWIINRYNPSDQLQTVNQSVLQSLNETYKLKEKNTVDSVITYLDEVILEFADSEEEKEIAYGKLQCEITSKKGHQFEIRLDKSELASHSDDSLKKTSNGIDSLRRISNVDFSKKIAADKLEQNKGKAEIAVTKSNLIHKKLHQDKEKTEIIIAKSDQTTGKLETTKIKAEIVEATSYQTLLQTPSKPIGTSHFIIIEATPNIPNKKQITVEKTNRNKISKNNMMIELIKSDPKLDSNLGSKLDYVSKTKSKSESFYRKSESRTGSNKDIKFNSKLDTKSESFKKGPHEIQLSVTSSNKDNYSPKKKEKKNSFLRKLNNNSKNTSSSINNIRKTFEELGLSSGEKTDRYKPSIQNAPLANRFSYIHNPRETSSGSSKPVPKTRPKSAELSIDFQLHRISNDSGNKTELRRTFIDPINEEETTVPQLATKNVDSFKNTNSKNTPSFLKSKNNSFLKSDLISSFNRIFKNSKPQQESSEETSSLDRPPIRTSPTAIINKSVRGFDSFILY